LLATEIWLFLVVLGETQKDLISIQTSLANLEKSRCIFFMARNPAPVLVLRIFKLDTQFLCIPLSMNNALTIYSLLKNLKMCDCMDAVTTDERLAVCNCCKEMEVVLTIFDDYHRQC
jgi:hypothetical protein